MGRVVPIRFTLINIAIDYNIYLPKFCIQNRCLSCLCWAIWSIGQTVRCCSVMYIGLIG